MRRRAFPAGHRLRHEESRLGKTNPDGIMRTCGAVHIQCRDEYTCAYKYVSPFFD
jgi:hypothetical protein